MNNALMDGLMTIAEKLQSNKWLGAIRHGFTTLMPIIITGAFVVLIRFVIILPQEGGVSLANFFPALSQLDPLVAAASYGTMEFFAVGFVFLVAMDLAKNYGREEQHIGLVAIASFIALCATSIPVSLTTEAGEVVTGAATGIANSYTNASGLFLAMFTAFVATPIYCKLTQVKALEIKLPDTVPTNIAKSFNVLIPAALTILAMATIGFVFNAIMGFTIYEAIAQWIQAPLAIFIGNIWGFVFIVIIQNILWFFGIHGAQTLGPVYSATNLEKLQLNVDAMQAGGVTAYELPTIINTSFYNVFGAMTGSGLTGGLIVAILLFSKRADYKAIGKLSVAPGLFNINETMTFGLPIVLNPLFLIPFIAAPAVAMLIGYFAMDFGISPKFFVNVPWTTPPVLAAFLASGGNIMAALTQLVALIATVFIYIPFVIASNKQEELEEEKTKA